MTTHRVTITYTAPSTFLSTDHWKQVYASFVSQLPLRNLHWKPSSRPTIRTIQELHVDLKLADTKRDEHTYQVPQTILEKPLVNVYVVVCEDTETYKNTVKKQIKDWHGSVAQRKNQEWLIVHIVRPDTKSAGARLFQVKASVLDKIKADFNVDKKDRCVQLVWATENENPAAWAEFIGKMKDGILTAFDAAVIQREEEVRRSEGQRQMPGWNFCTYFILKESLASSFEGMTLHEEALSTYEELEALFFQVLKDKNLTWFGSLASPSPRDDSASLLSIERKPFRDLILANSISIFDFRMYLLARQCILLSGMGKIVDVGRKAIVFIQTFGRRLQEVEDELLPPFFIEAWSYSSALSVVDQCDNWAKSLQLDKHALISFNAVKGELVELARHQLDVLGIAAGFLPLKPPFSNSVPSTKTRGITDTPDFSRISRAELQTALKDKEAFFEMYVALTNRAIEYYVAASRRKFALRMHGSLAALDVVRNRLPNALQTYTSLPAHYAPHGWTSLEAFMLTRSLDLHATSEKPKDKDWVNISLEYLKAYVQDMGRDLLISTDDHVAYTASVVKALRLAAEELESEVTHHEHPALSISIPKDPVSLDEHRDGAILHVIIRNTLPCPIDVDEIVVTLTGRDGERLPFVSEAQSLNPGSNPVTLFCPSATMGTYSLHLTQFAIGKLVLQWLHTPPLNPKSSKPKRPPTLISIPKDIRALDIRLRQPLNIEVGGEPRIIVALSTGRNIVSKAMLHLSAASGIQFDTETIKIEGEDDVSYEIVEDAIVLFDVPSDTTVALSVVHSDASVFHALKVNIHIDYVTSPEPEITRTLRLTRVVLISLPLTINVEDFFRGTRLFTRFTLSSTTHQYIRVKSLELTADGEGDDLKITKSLAQNSRITTVTPAQPGRFLFQLDSRQGPGAEFVRLRIKYRMLREEVEGFIDTAVRQALGESASPADHDKLVEVFVQALESDANWVDLYGITGELIVPDVACKHEQLQDGFKRATEVLRHGCPPEKNETVWREIAIKTDVPSVHILAAARLHLLPSPFSSDTSSARLPPLYAGQPIAATLSITTTFHWAPIDHLSSKTYAMRFDIGELTTDWLVSGRKTGDFVAKDGNTFETHITLIALHHGELALPKVAVEALAVATDSRMGSAVPSCRTHQLHGGEKALILPRGGRTTFIVDMGENTDMY
ncbi:trafficking protein particle complex subunit 10 [Irpex rosettiformis]|uniref:Trafficking protein particle complex subunit 10 n=1 Tax=Irpex rosettiformis TaxID=378272 RepID=A0ACB8UH13_9APHY|nr:trafficking protein particle complex subunit 10 [Irpex rosettiformis]